MPGYALRRRPRQRAFLRDLRAGRSVVPPFGSSVVLPALRRNTLLRPARNRFGGPRGV
jgi:hypothetical protein